jgi:hypothetical protein
MIARAVPALLLLLAACSGAAATSQSGPRDAGELERALAGRTPGTPVACLRSDQYRSVQPYAGTILYVAGRGRLWRNDVRGNCAGLARGDPILVKTVGGRYCEGDIVETRNRGFVTGSCTLGKFTPWTR